MQSLFSHFGEEQLMGFVNDQSPYYPFITSGTGPPRQARIVVNINNLNLNLRASMLVWCSFNWTRCASQPSTTKSWNQTRWGFWAKSFFHDRNGVLLLKTGSLSSPGRNQTLLQPCLVSIMWCSVPPFSLSPQLKTSTIFLAAKRQQSLIFAEVKWIFRIILNT